MNHNSSESIKKDIESINKQINNLEDALRQIKETKTESTDTNIDLSLKEKRTQNKINELRAKKEELEKQLDQEEEVNKQFPQEKVTKPAEKKLKVYISSTSEDLTDYRAVSRLAVNEEANCEPFLPNFGPKSDYSVAKYEATLQESDVVIFLFAFQFGHIPAQNQGGNGKDSITLLELQYARQYDKKVLVFLAKEDEHWSHGPDREGISKFRSDLGQPDEVFGYEESAGQDFRNLVINVLKSYKEELLKKQTPLENFPIASGMLLSGECIPFLGPGVYGDGPLSICALRKALGDEACKNCSRESCQKSSLATVAEFHELSPKRWLFLKELSRIINEQIRDVTAPPIYDLIKQIKPKPPLIISASLDLLLEKSLSDEGKENCLILCHAIRSKDKEKGTPKGVLVFKGPEDQSPVDHPANAIPELVALEEGGKTNLEGGKTPYIVYKPFGSPLLPCPGIDTVVITEEDYQILLNLLGSVETGVPAAFTKIFKRYPPIFLGYPLDVWHYRLMGQLLKSMTPSDNAPFYAVRKADLSLEQKAWDGLLVKLVSMDLGEFSQKVNKALQKEGVTR